MRRKCTVEGCPFTHEARGLCVTHYSQWRRMNKVLGDRRPTERRRINSNGYVLVQMENGFWELEHRLVLEGVLGRLLVPGESVHHRNGRTVDNRPKNLELWTGAIRSGHRAADLICPHCHRGYLDPPTGQTAPVRPAQGPLRGRP